jgi:branched-chain amino acid transport system substrate-binding protein
VSLSVKNYPGILMDVSFDANGDLDRESYMTKIVNGKQVVTDILPPLNKK